MAIMLRVLVQIPCESVQAAVAEALDLDRSADPLEIRIDDRVAVDSRQLRRLMVEQNN
jgi:hypothetical protein